MCFQFTCGLRCVVMPVCSRTYMARAGGARRLKGGDFGGMRGGCRAGGGCGKEKPAVHGLASGIRFKEENLEEEESAVTCPGGGGKVGGAVQCTGTPQTQSTRMEARVCVLSCSPCVCTLQFWFVRRRSEFVRLRRLCPQPRSQLRGRGPIAFCHRGHSSTSWV